MIVSVASGKGGTGKTTIAVNLALALEDSVPVDFLDCDVEEPNAHLFLRPVLETSEPVTLPVPVVDESRCSGCGTCAEVCAFHAILSLGGRAITFPELCHGCGGCARFCPEGAISEAPRAIGVVETGWVSRAGAVADAAEAADAAAAAQAIRFVQGRVDIGTALAPPVVKAVRSKAVPANGVVIIDSPPGTSCPVVASVKGSDYCILVTEPTPFGLNDLTLAVDMVRELGVPFGVVINRAGLGDDKVAAYCRQESIPVLLEIPFDRRFAASYARGGQLVSDFPELGDSLRGLWRQIRAAAGPLPEEAETVR
ncbi:MAG: ATP-binding protein [Firmicutes bacterium]|nr:ATP-binding protein [Bacillota bacterium]